MLKYKEDRRTLGLLGASLFVMVLPYFLSGLISLNFGLYFVFFVLQVSASYICGAINHNHCSTFITRELNLGMNVFLSLAMGRSTTYLTIPHNYNHHGKFKTEGDWSDPRKMGNFRGLFGVVFYSVRIFMLMTFRQNTEVSLKTHPRTLYRIYAEQAILLVYFFALIRWNPHVFWFSTFPGIVGAIFGLLAINLFQHGFCDFDDPYNHSRNFVSPIYNWWLTNNGYHTYHHDHPKVHWSKLPALHAEKVDPYIRPELNERSWTRFVFCEFLPAGRDRLLVIKK